MPKTYVCSRCKGEFEYAWTDEEAQAELQENFPGATPEESDIVCDNCYKELCPWAS